MTPIVFAVHCHPDDIEFTCAGTLFRLKDAGCELHYMTVANGCVGSMTTGVEETARVRAEESRAAAALLGAAYHESIANDLEVFYGTELIRRLLAVVREVGPDIMLVPSPQDYMEDHMNTSRVAVTAAFCRGMPNYPSIPPVAPIQKDVVLYHAMPHGLRDELRHSIVPDFYVDIGPAIDRKERMLAAYVTRFEESDTWITARSHLEEIESADYVPQELLARIRGAYETNDEIHNSTSVPERIDTLLKKHGYRGALIGALPDDDEIPF